MTKLLMLLALATLCAACDRRPTGEGDAALGPWRPLASFYAALADLQAGRRDRVAVLQIGDSHTANDAFSSRIRDLMQDRFGNGGRGLLPPGIPYRYYRPAQVTVRAEGFTPRRGAADAGGPFGLAGLLQEAQGSATMTLEADPPGLARVSIQALTQPGGGTLDITTSDGAAVSLPTAANRPGVARIQAPSGPATRFVQVAARGDGPVAVLSWTAERPGPGVTWSNLGTIGATVEKIRASDPALMQAEAAALQPALILLAFGANEGFKDSTDLVAYPGHVRAALRALRQAAPAAAIIVAGPPGGVRQTKGGAGVACPADGKQRWSVPPNLPRVREIERQVAAAEGAYFWDWSAAMGGDCTMVAWAAADPPLAARDHVHLLQPGARATAEALFQTLMQGYDRYPHSASPR